jgi:hypothetical protein
LQADFLLIASREDIDVSSKWNARILNSIPEAFASAITTLIDGPLRYSWVGFLHKRPDRRDYFDDIQSKIFRVLSKAKILESTTGELTIPSELRFVPTNLRDKSGQPLIGDDFSANRYLSLEYPEESRETLSILGVGILSTQDLLVSFERYVRDTPVKFQQNTHDWHAQLCKVLLQAVMENDILITELTTLEMVPTVDGQWVSPAQSLICFPAVNGNECPVPLGINIHEIETLAAADPIRRQLYTRLGARDMSKQLVQETIIELHSQSKLEISNLSCKELITHAKYLYLSGWHNPGSEQIWVMTAAGAIQSSLQTYTVSDGPYAAVSIFEKFNAELPILHPDYHEISKSNSGEKWLSAELKLAKHVRLLDSCSEKPDLNTDFLFLLKTMPSSEFLVMLRDTWEFYSGDLIESSEKEDQDGSSDKAALRKRIASMEVRCVGGEICPMNQTVLPRGETNKSMSFHFLDVPDPEDECWGFLKYFNVVIDIGIEVYAQSLRNFKESSCLVSDVSIIYQRIQSQFKPEQIR